MEYRVIYFAPSFEVICARYLNQYDAEAFLVESLDGLRSESNREGRGYFILPVKL